MRNEPTKKRRVFILFKLLVQLGILAAIAVVTITVATGVLNNIAEADEQLAAVELELDAAQERAREIADSSAYARSISFKEYIARNWLDLVRRDEVLFIMVGD